MDRKLEELFGAEDAEKVRAVLREAVEQEDWDTLKGVSERVGVILYCRSKVLSFIHPEEDPQEMPQ